MRIVLTCAEGAKSAPATTLYYTHAALQSASDQRKSTRERLLDTMYRQEGRRRSRFCEAKVLRELDTVVSSRVKGGCFATFIERKTRLYTAIKMPDRTAGSMELAIKQVYSSLPNPSKSFITATTDRSVVSLSETRLRRPHFFAVHGGEFACFENIQNDLGVKVYFADPYCLLASAWQ